MFRHLTKYLPSVVASAISGVAILAVLTRILPAGEYGLFALSTAAAVMLQAMFTQWLSLAIVRFYTASDDAQEQNNIIASVAVLFAIEILVVLAISVIVALTAFESNADRAIILLSFVYYAAFSLFTLVQRLHVAKLRSARFSVNAVIQTMLSALFAITLVYFVSPTATYAITGMILGFLVTCLLDARTTIGLLRFPRASARTMKCIVQFAWPIIPSAGLATLTARMGQFIVGGLLGAAAIGQYNAGFSLANQAISSVFLLVALVAHPMAISAFERKSTEALLSQLGKNLTVMMGLALPAAVGLYAVRSEISRIVLGETFRQSAIDLMPILVSALLIGGIRDHYIAHSFHLAKKLWLPIFVLVPVAAGSFIANYLLIPDFGVIGAAYVMLGAQLVALILDYALSFRAIPMPVPLTELGKIAAATAIMAILLFAMPQLPIWFSLFSKIIIGFISYLMAIFLLNPGGLRKEILTVLAKKMVG